MMFRLKLNIRMDTEGVNGASCERADFIETEKRFVYNVSLNICYEC